MMGVLKQPGLGIFLAAKSMLSPVAFGVTGAIRDDQGRVLLVRQSYARGWRLPGGGVNRGEMPASAVLRELAEEVGLAGGTAELFGLYSRPAGWFTNVIALYAIRGGTVAFRPNLEVRAVCFADPNHPPDDTAPSARRRLAELAGGPRSEGW